MKNLLSVDLYEYMTLDRSKREIRLHRVEIRDEVEVSNSTALNN